jgi:hypothetical protein
MCIPKKKSSKISGNEKNRPDSGLVDLYLVPKVICSMAPGCTSFSRRISSSALRQPPASRKHVYEHNYPTRHSPTDWLETNFWAFWEFPTIGISCPRNQTGSKLVSVRWAFGVLPKIFERKNNCKKMQNRQFLNFDALTTCSVQIDFFHILT